MKNLIALYTVFSVFSIQAACVQEFKTSGLDLLHREDKATFFVDINDDGRFVELAQIEQQLNSLTTYSVQKQIRAQKATGYDDRYIKYYHYARVLDFLQEFQTRFDQNDYIVKTIGHSLSGRELKVVHPRELDSSKKLIVMFGRHHGDEGTANWIIEGFVQDFFSKPEVLAEYQLVLYPMVNPDGAENQVRYNNNRYDLNRVWGITPAQSKDEVAAIHSHLEEFVIKTGRQPIITLDMHGSFTEDFIYRVGSSTFGRSYYHMQQLFIDDLGSRDQWQAGNYELSEGAPGMARIRLAKEHGWHTLTHETPRDIPLNNRQGRSLETLKAQGVAALETIQALY